MTRKPFFKVGAQIFILIVATIAFSYFAHESFGGTNPESENVKSSSVAGTLLFLVKIARTVLWNERTLVSALDYPIYTCMDTIDDRICAEYLYDACAANCREACIPSPASVIAECKIGTCYDSIEGTCAVGSTRKLCQDDGGVWFDDPNGNIPQCRRGCCMISGGPSFVTDGECTRVSNILGVEKDFRADIRTEFACLVGAESARQGACLLGKDPITQKNLCRFTTKTSCDGLSGSFYVDVLCSNPQLDTNCEKQVTTSCIYGKAEIYWFDSCGNIENIYSADKIQSWNEGRVLGKADSCSLSSGTDWLGYQKTCGNCDYPAGSACGEKTASEFLSDLQQDVVCKNLACDSDGDNIKDKKHGESWCVYEGTIGVDSERAADTPGSRHFKKVCLYGEIRTEPCADYRNEICIENQVAGVGGDTVSFAACRMNRATLCLGYNANENRDYAMDECSKNSDCFVKDVDIGDHFRFSACVPKYATGFDMVDNPNAAVGICGMGSISCEIVWINEYGTYHCKQHCNCDDAVFARKLNDFCMSLGDCGAEVNYNGTLTTGGYRISGPTAQLDDEYFNDIKRYSEVVPGQYIDAGNGSEFFAYLGIPTEISTEDVVDPATTGSMALIGALSGALGTISLAAVTALAAVPAAGSAAAAAGASTVAVGALGTVGAACAGAALGAVIGLGITYGLIAATGIGPGISPAVMGTLLVAGAVGGAIIGAAILSGASLLGAIPIVGWVLLILVIITIVVLAALGTGDVRKRTVRFECNPWQAPTGGANCKDCGGDGLPCSKYKCQSLGATCKFVNEGTSEEDCVAIGVNDAAPPLISPLDSALLPGHVYSDANEFGVKLKSASGDGCIGTFSSVRLGILLDKAGSCRYAFEPLAPAGSGNNFAGIPDSGIDASQLAAALNTYTESDFSAGIIRENHTTIFTIPSAESLGIPGYDPSTRTDVNMYIRCKNANGYESARDYVVNMCAKPGTDLTPPIVSIAEPLTGFVKYGATSQRLKVFTTEPANCKWSLGDKDYSLMENSMVCENDMTDQTIYGWACNSTLPIVTSSSTFYIRCEDRPWANDSATRNKNAESKVLNLERTSRLEIVSASPNNQTLTFGTPVSSINVEARTSGGMSTGALCLASYDGQNYFITLNPNPSGTVHTQILPSYTSGSKKIWIKCEDSVGNIAQRNISFKVAMDSTPPEITRIYYDTGSLYVKTNEPATCALSEEECNFNFANGTLMSGTGTSHEIAPKTNTIYYVKCKDPYENSKGTCDAKLKVFGSVAQQL